MKSPSHRSDESHRVSGGEWLKASLIDATILTGVGSVLWWMLWP